MEKVLPKRRYTQDEADVIRQVREDYTSSRNSRSSNSYHPEKDWNKVWDAQEKVDIGYSELPDEDDFQSNVKSPMASGRIESTMQKLRRLNIQYIVRPNDAKEPRDKRKARVIQELLNNLFSRKKFKARLMTWFKDCLTHGSAFMHVYYLRKKRTVKMPNVDVSSMTEEEKIKLSNKERVYTEEVVYDYDDIAFEPVKRQEIYEDPSARNLHGTSYEAQWIIRRMLPSLSQFKAMFSADPDAKNVSKVRPISFYGDSDTPFFEPPKDTTDANCVELLHYYNKAEDRYVVVANDVLIKDVPLPYKHKQLPYVKIDAYEVLHQFNSMGIPDKTKNIQAEEEILKNMQYDRLHITGNPIVKVKKSIYGEFSKAYQNAEPGLMIPVNNQDDVQTLDYPAQTYDMFKALEMIDRDAVTATQIDPIQMGMSQKYVSATTSMFTKEQSDAFIASLIDIWTEPLIIAGEMCVSLMSQFYPIPKIEKAGKTAKNKNIRLLDIEINPKTLEVREKRGKYSYLEIKPEFFNINGDWEIEIAPESVEVQSKAIEAQKTQAMIAQLAPFFIDPNDPKSVMSNPQGWIDGPKVLADYLQTMGKSQEFMAVSIEDEDISAERAELQGKKLQAGEVVPGIAGEPEVHVWVHVEQMRILNGKKKNIEKQFDEFPPEFMELAMQTPEAQEMIKLDQILQLYVEHLMADTQPKVMDAPQVMKDTQPKQAEVPMPSGLSPAGGSQPPMPVGGNQQNGMTPPPQNEMPQGRPPMAAQ